MALSDLAQRLLATHARNPNKIYYAVEVLGSMFQDSNIQQLDQAYDELVNAELMEKAGVTVSYFGGPKSLCRITEKGLQEFQSTAA